MTSVKPVASPANVGVPGACAAAGLPSLTLASGPQLAPSPPSTLSRTVPAGRCTGLAGVVASADTIQLRNSPSFVTCHLSSGCSSAGLGAARLPVKAPNRPSGDIAEVLVATRPAATSTNEPSASRCTPLRRIPAPLICGPEGGDNGRASCATPGVPARTRGGEFSRPRANRASEPIGAWYLLHSGCSRGVVRQSHVRDPGPGRLLTRDSRVPAKCDRAQIKDASCGIYAGDVVADHDASGVVDDDSQMVASKILD